MAITLRTFRYENWLKQNYNINEEAVIQEALRYLLQNRPDLRLALAVHRYQTDESVSLAGAAAVAGVSSEQMKEILVSRGVQLRLGPANLAEAEAEVTAVEER